MIHIIVLLLTYYTAFQLFLETGFCLSISVCARVSVCVQRHLLDTRSSVLCLAAIVLVIVYHFLPIFFVFFFIPPLSFLASFFRFSLYVLAVLLALVPMPRPSLWHHGWLCPIRSAAGEGGEWDAGSSESCAGSHHTVLRPRNVSGTTTTDRVASLPRSLRCLLRTNPNQSVPARSQNTFSELPLNCFVIPADHS